MAGTIEDMYDGRQKVWLVFLWNSCKTLALVIGPIYGSYIAHSIGWRWIYYTAAIATAGALGFLFFIRESRPTKLLSSKLEALKESNEVGEELKPEDNSDHINNTQTFFKVVLLRPIHIFVAEPVVMMVTVMGATVWGVIYLFTESLTVVYSQYGWQEHTTSLAFIAVGIGIPFGILPRLWDLHIMTRRQRSNAPVKPEDKLTGFAIAAPTLAVGLWLFSWTVPPLVRTHWIVSMLGLALVGFAVNEFAYTLNGYLTDSYTVYASSGFAALAFVRAVVSGVMPLFAYQMYTGLGSNVAGSIVAAVATVFCVAPYVFLKYGRTLRERGPFGQKAEESD